MAHLAFHNTTPLTGDLWLDAVRTAEKQDEAVLQIFASGGVWSPSQVHEHGLACGRKWLLTSVRRAISNLTKAELLVQTGKSIEGPHGRPENTWSKK